LHTQAVTLLEATGDIELLRHFKQALLPFTALYSPCAHGAQGPPLGPVNPAKHWHAVEALDPTGAKELAGQSVQAALPADTLNVLTGQFWQELTFELLRTL
jgi:hypothetical protein